MSKSILFEFDPTLMMNTLGQWGTAAKSGLSSAAAAGLKFASDIRTRIAGARPSIQAPAVPPQVAPQQTPQQPVSNEMLRKQQQAQYT